MSVTNVWFVGCYVALWLTIEIERINFTCPLVVSVVVNEDAKCIRDISI